MADLLTLAVTFLLHADQLEVTYTVTNHSSSVVYLTNLAVRVERGTGPVPDPNVAFVYLEGNTVHVTKRRPPIPEDRFFTPRPHYVTPLEPGADFRETLELPLPLEENIPYTSLEPEGRDEWAENIYFSVGYIEADEALEAVELERGGVKVTLLKSVLPDPEKKQELPPVVERFLTSLPDRLEIPVRKIR